MLLQQSLWVHFGCSPAGLGVNQGRACVHATHLWWPPRLGNTRSSSGQVFSRSTVIGGGSFSMGGPAPRGELDSCVCCSAAAWGMSPAHPRCDAHPCPCLVVARRNPHGSPLGVGLRRARARPSWEEGPSCRGDHHPSHACHSLGVRASCCCLCSAAAGLLLELLACTAQQSDLYKLR